MSAGTKNYRAQFHGRIAGFGTESGVRVVVGIWDRSPFGRFADIMVQTSDGHRQLIAPSERVARFVARTYTFDEVSVHSVTVRRVSGGIDIQSSPLTVELRLGSVTPLGRLLRIVPEPVAVSPLWLRLIDPAARVLLPGSRTAGTAGNGESEYYGVTTSRRVLSIHGSRNGVALGKLARLSPPVTFGFGSAPALPQIVDVVTTIRWPREGRDAS